MKVLITGGTNGMGKGVARALAARPGVELVILGRSEERCRETCDELARIAAPERVSFVRCDLTRLRDVRAAIAEIRARHQSLDAIFVNAGVGYAARRVDTEDGMLEHFQVNYLSHFMLTLNLLDLLEGSAHGGRVVFNATDFGKLDLDDLQLTKRWTFQAGVGVGMVAKHMFYMRLNQLYAARGGAAVSCFGFLIPKTVWSNQLNIIPVWWKALSTVAKWFGQFISIDECGAIMAPLFLEGPESSVAKAGRFLTWKNGVFVDAGKRPASGSPADWERLWNISLELCGDELTKRCAERLGGLIPSTATSASAARAGTARAVP
jgi:NAD(P)-dependent dehydrogenase (short-subunit alcohol dehydrogenase family)